MNTSDHDTIFRLKNVHKEKSWRAIAVAWGRDPSYAATLSRAANGGHISIAEENFIRARLGLFSKPHTAPAPVCQTCGVVHAVGDCHGVDGEPVILPDGARIVSPAKTRRKRKRYWRPAIPPELRDELEPIIKKFISTRTAAAPPGKN